MQRFEVQCAGLSPILMDPMTEETLDAIGTGNRPPEVRDRPVEDIAAGKIYRDLDTKRIGLPVEMLISCLVGAGRKVKNNKMQISTAKDTTLFDFLTVDGIFLPFANIPEEAAGEEKAEMKFWRVDKRRGVGNTGVAVRVIRPSFKDWAFTVTIEIDESKVNEMTVRKLFDVAGSAVGLGSFRPSKKGPFGRFVVRKWTDITPAEEQKKGRGRSANRFVEAETEENAVKNDGRLVESGV